MEISCRVYKPRRPRESPLYGLVERHLEESLFRGCTRHAGALACQLLRPVDIVRSPGPAPCRHADAGSKRLSFFDYYGRAYPEGRRQIVLSATHLSADARYRWLNDVVCASTGEVRSRTDRPTELVMDVAELAWKPIAE